MNYCYLKGPVRHNRPKLIQPENEPMSSSSSQSTRAPHVIEDCRGVLQLLSDGTVLRSQTPLLLGPALDSHYPNVTFKDTQFDPTRDLTLRLYKPRGPHRDKLPVLLYFHGGGFCIGSFAWPVFHNVCLRLAADLGALVVAPDYRLAPENRLPAAIHDAVKAVNWIRSESDPFLSDADFNNIFISGESAGGNLTHHLALKLDPAGVNGYILLQPFFSGTQSTESEASWPEDGFFSLERSNQYWRLSLPVGSTRDDPLANPFGPGGPRWGEVEVGPMLVVVGGGDLLRDREVEYGKRLREFGKKVEVVEIEGAEHGFFSLDSRSPAADKLVRLMKRFMEENWRGVN